MEAMEVNSNSLKYHSPLGPVLTISISGTIRLMIPMHTSSALVRISWHLCEISKSYFKALVLDPNVKLAYAEDKWDCEAREDGVACLEATVCMLANLLATMLTLFLTVRSLLHSTTSRIA